MVSFDDCLGNQGALQFMTEAYAGDMPSAFKAEKAFGRVIREGIKGADLYILWNDCCGRDTEFAVQVMADYDIDAIKEHIKGDGGRGIPFAKG